MSKKIVAIGGGEYERKKSDGTLLLYELKDIHKEIVKLSGKTNPNVLILNHALENDIFEQNGNTVLMNLFSTYFSCNCKCLEKKDLNNVTFVSELFDWADIIYENGGDTVYLIELWKKYGLDKKIIDAYNKGKVISGVSAGATCLFNCGNVGNFMNKDINKLDCLNIIDAYFCPHYNLKGKYESVKNTLKFIDKVGISLSNCCAIEIIDNNYRLLTTNASNYGINAYGIKSYWENNEYIEEKIDKSMEFKNLEDLLEKQTKIKTQKM